MKKRKPPISLWKRPTAGWAHTYQHLHEEITTIQIDVAPLVAGITDCLHIFYPGLQKSFIVTMNSLTEADLEHIAEKRSHFHKNIEKEEVLSDGRTHCYLIREEPVGASYSGVTRYIVRRPSLQQAGTSLHLLIQVPVDAPFEEEIHTEMIGAVYPELGQQFTLMLSESDGTDREAIMDELLNVMFVQGWNDGNEGIHASMDIGIGEDEGAGEIGGE